MSERARNIAIVTVMTVLGAVIVGLIASAPSEQDRVAGLGARIMCPVCQGESIAQSGSAMARDMMSLVADRVDGGATDEEIVAELLASYTGAVLLDPPVAGPTLVLWLAPAIALVAGVVVIAWWRREPGPDVAGEAPAGEAPRGRRAIGALVLIGLFAGAVVAAGFFLQDRDDGTGVAGLAVDDLDDVSNETMEAVIASNADNPQVDGMRLALAERYFEAGDYRSAFPHYLSVAESSGATADQVVTALIGLGWMAWDGNAQAETALGLLDEALAIDPGSVSARYLKGRVLWCGTDASGSAADLFTALLADDALPEQSRDLIEADLTAISDGRGCE
jgi:cytochrome c-type biogenesis protein CcmH